MVVAGALYMNRWHRHARRFVRGHTPALRGRPGWLVSSGNLDHIAPAGELPPVPQVAKLAERIGARGHVTSGGRVTADAKGFPASAIAKIRAGDWRDTEQVREFAAVVAVSLTGAEAVQSRPSARPSHRPSP